MSLITPACTCTCTCTMPECLTRFVPVSGLRLQCASCSVEVEFTMLIEDEFTISELKSKQTTASTKTDPKFRQRALCNKCFQMEMGSVLYVYVMYGRREREEGRCGSCVSARVGQQAHQQVCGRQERRVTPRTRSDSMPQTNKRSSSNVGFRIATTSQLPFPVHFTIFFIEPAQAQLKLNLKIATI